MCVEYSTFGSYVQSKENLLGKIRAIENIEDQLLIAMLDQASGAGVGISVYEFDDGQARIKTNYRNGTELTNALNALNTIKQRYINQMNGRRVTLRDAGTLNFFGGCC